MTHQFYCHYTGRDGHTPRRRQQTLTFFDHVPSIGNSPSSPTPLWVEVIGGYYMFHAQLSDTVAVYIDFNLPKHSISILCKEEGHEEIRDIAVQLIRDFLDLTTYLVAAPNRITPPILNAYREARPSEYQQLLSLLNH